MIDACYSDREGNLRRCGDGGLDDPDRAIRAGDKVKHNPSGETWVVAYVEGDYLAWCGWPPGEARLSDCTLIEACSDAQHRRWLEEISKSSGIRASKAKAALAGLLA